MLLGLGMPARGGEFFFKDGDTVVVMGDSITEQHLYSNYLEMWTVSRFPEWKLRSITSASAATRSPGGNSRFARDVLAHNATAMTVDFGMNDGGYRPFDEVRFKTTWAACKESPSRPRMPSPRCLGHAQPGGEERGRPGNRGLQRDAGEVLRGCQGVAARTAACSSTSSIPVVAVQDKARAADPTNRIGGGDAVHPGPPGQAVMAWAILKGLRFPSLVAAVEIDASSGKVPRPRTAR